MIWSCFPGNLGMLNRELMGASLYCIVIFYIHQEQLGVRATLCPDVVVNGYLKRFWNSKPHLPC